MDNKKEDLYNQIYYIAVYNSLFPDQAVQHRNLARWFSKNFNTPYEKAQQLSSEELLLHKLEWEMQDMSDKDIRKSFNKFINRKQEKKKEEQAQNADAQWEKEMEEKAKREQELQELKRAEEMARKKDLIKKDEPPSHYPPDIVKTF